MFILILTVNFVIALWVFYDSQKHGYSVWKGLLWAIGVFFVLIVFLPLYLFSRSKRKKLLARAHTSPSFSPGTRCFYCGQSYSGTPELCPHCGQSLKR